MLTASKSKSAGFRLIAVAVCLALPAVWAVLVNPQNAQAKGSSERFMVELIQGDFDHDPIVDPPLWAPEDLAQTV